MSNIHPTIGRTVQYVDGAGKTRAAIITEVQNDGVQLAVLGKEYTTGVIFFDNVKPESNASRIGVYRITWIGRQ